MQEEGPAGVGEGVRGHQPKQRTGGGQWCPVSVGVRQDCVGGSRERTGGGTGVDSQQGSLGFS
jgi:hypothetical protein